MGKVFISYRRNDSALEARIIFERVVREIGSHRVFMDIATMIPGENFRARIDKELEDCDIVLVIIGPKWLGMSEGGVLPRLHETGDYVRYEIETALKLSKQRGLTLIPLLVGSARAPDESSLPISLRELSSIHAVGLDFPTEADSGLSKVVELVRKHARLADEYWRYGKIQSKPSESWMLGEGLDRFGKWAEAEFFGSKQRFRWIAPGHFLMGDNEGGRTSPKHYVTISSGLWLGEVVCTKRLWRSVVQGNAVPQAQDDMLPIDGVSWIDVCEKFIPKIQSIVGDKYIASLPLESEWEYSCRAGTETVYHFGNEFDPSKANVFGSDLVDVYSYDPNPWGLYQMHGNVMEWCFDSLYDYPSDPVVDPVGTGSRSKIRRGGCQGGGAHTAASTWRSYDLWDKRHRGVGFRFAIRSAD